MHRLHLNVVAELLGIIPGPEGSVLTEGSGNSGSIFLQPEKQDQVKQPSKRLLDRDKLKNKVNGVKYLKSQSRSSSIYQHSNAKKQNTITSKNALSRQCKTRTFWGR